MAHLVISFITAAVVALAVFLETASFGLAFLAYAGSGTLVLMLVVLAAAIATTEDERMTVAQG